MRACHSSWAVSYTHLDVYKRQPQSLYSVLRKYQRDGYRWLRTLDGYGMGGILADDMGLGLSLIHIWTPRRGP